MCLSVYIVSQAASVRVWSPGGVVVSALVSKAVLLGFESIPGRIVHHNAKAGTLGSPDTWPNQLGKSMCSVNHITLLVNRTDEVI